MSNIEKKAGYLFQASMQIGEGIALSVSGNMAEGATSAEMISELDKVLVALEKQNLKRMKLPAVQGALKDQKDALDRTKKQFEELRALEQSRGKLKGAEGAQIATCKTHIERLTEQIEKGEEILAALEQEAA